jgi:hypothetical protein
MYRPAEKRPNVGKVRHVNTDGSFTEVPELIRGIVDVLEGEYFRYNSTDYLV